MEKKLNPIQTAFLAELANHTEGVTLFELKLEGKEFKSGSINTLVKQGRAKIIGKRTFECDVVFNGKVIGKTTKTAKVFALAE